MSERRDAIEAAVAANDVRALRNLYQDWITEEQDKQEERIARARLEERQAIVTWLRARSARWLSDTPTGLGDVLAAADQIERGDHEGSG